MVAGLITRCDIQAESWTDSAATRLVDLLAMEIQEWIQQYNEQSFHSHQYLHFVKSTIYFDNASGLS
jgi:hypothetical protein